MPYFPHANFLESELIMAQLAEKISPCESTDVCQITAISGVLGVGKTQMAVQAAYRVAEHHPETQVFWISATSQHTITKSFVDIADELDLFEGLPLWIREKRAKDIVKKAFGPNPRRPWLMVVDNVDETDIFYGTDKAPGLKASLPSSCEGSILIITQNPEVVKRLDAPSEHIFSVGFMDLAQATSMLERGLGRSNLAESSSTAELVDLLLFLPFTIAQAVAYMNENNISPEQYLSDCQMVDKDFINFFIEGFSKRGRGRKVINAVATT